VHMIFLDQEVNLDFGKLSTVNMMLLICCFCVCV
jgi:hypothetical protein